MVEKSLSKWLCLAHMVPAAQAPAARFLGFDFGTRRTGVALGENVTGGSRALTTLTCKAGEPSWDELQRLVEEWQPQALVVGLPLALDGGEQPMSGRARRFARQLGEHFNLPVHLHDERHTSQEAARRFAVARQAGTRRRRDGAKLDAMAAAVMLESWLAAGKATQDV